VAEGYYIPWYSYGVFRHTREQIIWAIDNRGFFDIGKWPSEPKEYETDEYDKESKAWVKVIVESSYVDLQGPGQFKPDATFVPPKVIWADISKRLKLTKTDGKLLIKEIEAMPRPNYDDLEYDESKCALDYISLWDFSMRPPYYQWRQRRMYYIKTGR